MSQINTREIVLLAPTVLTTSGTGPDINAIQAWQAAVISINASTISGTLPTFNFFIQKKLGQAQASDLVGNPPTGTAIYDDLLAFTTITTNTTRITQVCTSAQTPTANSTLITTADWAQSDAAMTAGDIRVGPLGGLWRVKFVMGGTTPQGTFTVTTQLIPFST
jgi:hypothetical protein